MSKIEQKIEELQLELKYYLDMTGNSKLRWEIISQIEHELDLLKSLIQ